MTPKRKKWMREYRKKHPEYIKRGRFLSRVYNTKNRKKIIKKRATKKAKLREIFGNSCCICKKTPKRLLFHEVCGKSHSLSNNYILNHVEDFIPMCQPCHVVLHKISKTNSKDIFLKLLHKLI